MLFNSIKWFYKYIYLRTKKKKKSIKLLTIEIGNRAEILLPGGQEEPRIFD